MLRVLLFAVVLGAPVAAAPPEPSSRPDYSFLRYQEDWSSFDAANAADADPWDALKHLDLNADGSVWASFGGHLRGRLESWSGFGFGTPADDDDTFGLSRLALHADIHFGEAVRVFVEGKSALSTDRDLPGGRRTLDVDALDLEQLFADIRLDLDGATLTVRPGRQAFSLGKQRLISPLPWANTLRRWDGISAIVVTGDWQMHAFWSVFAPVQKYSFNDGDDDTQFFGIYATGPLGETGHKLDLYFLGLDRDRPVTFNGTTGDEQRLTLGGRLFGTLGRNDLDFDLEGAYQFGEVGAGDIDAFMIATELGWTLADQTWSPRLFAGFDYASGDSAAGGDVETFNQLFPLGHAYLGYIDAVGRQNVIDASVGASAKPIKGSTLTLRSHFLWRADDADALYNAGGGVVRAGGPGTSNEVGIEIDLTWSHKFDRHVNGLFGYSHFFAGDFIEETGASEDINFLYAQLQYTF